jgi:hypothetical protein
MSDMDPKPLVAGPFGPLTSGCRSTSTLRGVSVGDLASVLAI